MKLITSFIFFWFVVTFSGTKVSGPYDLAHECNEIARVMNQTYKSVYPTCKWFSE